MVKWLVAQFKEKLQSQPFALSHKRWKHLGLEWGPEQGTASRLSNKTTSEEKAWKLDKAIPFFRVQRRMHFLIIFGSVGRTEKKKLKKKSQEVSE